MTRFFAIIAVTALAAAPARADDSVELLGEAFVSGETVKLGNVARVNGGRQGLLNQVELCSAPRPGASKRIDAALVNARLRELGMGDEEVKIAGASAVRVTRLHLEVSDHMLADDLRSFVEREMPWNVQDATIDISVPNRVVVVPDGAVAVQWRVNPPYRYLGSGTVRGEILVDGKVEETVFARVDVENYVEVLVAETRIERGERLLDAGVVREKRAYSAVRNAGLLDQGELDGFVARSTIQPGDVITKRNIVPEKIVKRNQLVTVEVVTEGLRIRAQAKAVSDGYVGEEIVCENLDTRQRFRGFVRKNGMVVVP